MSESTSPDKSKLHILYVAAMVVAVLFCAAAIGYAAYWPKGDVKVEKKAAVEFVKAPNLAGYDYLKAKEVASSSGLTLRIDRWVTSKVFAVNSVISQKPQAFEPIKAGGTVTVTVSSGVTAGSSQASVQEKTSVIDNPKPLPSPAIRATDGSLRKTVVIDPGHQRRANLDKESVGPGSTTKKPKTQGGTSGVKTGTPEYKVTLQIAKRLKVKLMEHNFKVIMIREADDVDISNSERAEIANGVKADLVIRIHADGSTNRNKSGISTLYPAKNEWTGPIFDESLEAARIIHDSVIGATKHNDNGLVARDDLTGFNWSKVPVLLVETGFLTNPQEEADLLNASYQDILAEAIAAGAAEYLK